MASVRRTLERDADHLSRIDDPSSQHVAVHFSLRVEAEGLRLVVLICELEDLGAVRLVRSGIDLLFLTLRLRETLIIGYLQDHLGHSRPKCLREYFGRHLLVLDRIVE